MSRFVLTAQLQLQAPTNTAQVVRQIQNQLNNVQVNVQVQGTAQAQRQVQQVAQSLNNANTAASNLGRTFAISIRRFTALAVATRAVSLFTNTLGKAIDEAIQFERELIRISQVTGKAVNDLRSLTDTITNLSTSLGVSSKSLIGVSRILSQAGLNASETETALKTLARTELAPTFDDITETAEGAVAIFNQFRQGAEALEAQLGSINAVAGQFAVEAGDLIGVVRRVGGVFKASGGDLNELIALFTSVRATTRESAESIATGLRTIFTRIQRPKTIEFLKQFGVELLDLEGKFVGPFEAVRQLSQALAGLEQGDVTFIRIAEELGGFRQIGKVIPLLQQFTVAQQALNVAQKGSESLATDAASAQAALAVRITKVKEEFLALVRSITETSTFQIFANTALSLASTLIKLADSIKPLIPLLTALFAIKAARGIGDFLTGFRGGVGSNRTFNKGGKVLAFARGGMVPGSGNRDTVPAMLQPGEFVIRKSSVNKLGAGTLTAMNENRFNNGGRASRVASIVTAQREETARKRGQSLTPGPTISFKDKTTNIGNLVEVAGAELTSKADKNSFAGAFLRPGDQFKRYRGTNNRDEILRLIQNSPAYKLITKTENKNITQRTKKSLEDKAIKYAEKNEYDLFTGSLSGDVSTRLENTLYDGILNTITNGVSSIEKELQITSDADTATLLRRSNIDQTIGNVFEAVLATAGVPYVGSDGENASAPFDFRSGLGDMANKFTNMSSYSGIPTDAKTTFSTRNIQSLIKKVSNYNLAEAEAEFDPILSNLAAKLQSSDNVEAKAIKSLAEKRGLTESFFGGKINKYASGGLIQKFAYGGKATQKQIGFIASLLKSFGINDIYSGGFDPDLSIQETSTYIDNLKKNRPLASKFQALRSKYQQQVLINSLGLPIFSRDRYSRQLLLTSALSDEDVENYILNGVAPKGAVDAPSSFKSFNMQQAAASGTMSGSRSDYRARQSAIKQFGRRRFAFGGLIQKFAQGGLPSLSNYRLQSKELNKAIAGGNLSSKQQSDVKSLDSIMKDPLPRRLYSGFKTGRRSIIESLLGKEKNYGDLLNKTFSFPSYLSTSLNEDVARTFGDIRGGLLYINSKGKGINVLQNLGSGSAKGLYENEAEYILPRNSRFKIKNIIESVKGPSPQGWPADWGKPDFLELEVDQLKNGGLIQKFAYGGRATQKQIGFIASLLKSFDISDIYSGGFDPDLSIQDTSAYIDNLKNNRAIASRFKALRAKYGQRVFINQVGLPIFSRDQYSRKLLLSSAISDEDIENYILNGVAPKGAVDAPENFRALGIQQAAAAGTMSASRSDYRARQSAVKQFGRRRFASGGGVGTDTVPALLTPGEFVINKKSAQAIGYGSLNRMNKIGKYAKGGTVGSFGKNIQHFRFGGEAAEKNIAASFNREGYELVGSMGEVRQIFDQFIGGLTTLPDTLKQTLSQVETFQLTKDQKFKSNAGELTGDQYRGISLGGKIGVNIGQAGTHTVKHEAAHEVDRALGGGKVSSRTEGTFQNKIAKELQKSMEKEVGASAYRLDQAELFADALAKAPPEVQKILVSTTDAAKGSAQLAAYFEKVGRPVSGLADLSADEFGGQQNKSKAPKGFLQKLMQSNLGGPPVSSTGSPPSGPPNGPPSAPPSGPPLPPPPRNRRSSSLSGTQPTDSGGQKSNNPNIAALIGINVLPSLLQQFEMLDPAVAKFASGLSLAFTGLETFKGVLGSFGVEANNFSQIFGSGSKSIGKQLENSIASFSGKSIRQNAFTKTGGFFGQKAQQTMNTQLQAKFGKLAPVVKVLGPTIDKFGSAVGRATGPALTASATFLTLNTVVSSLLNTQEEYKKAVESGNATLAGQKAVQLQAEKDIDNFGAAVSGGVGAITSVFFGPVVGQFAGNLTAIALGAAKLIPGFESLTSGIRDALASLGFADSTEKIRDLAQIAALSAASLKALNESTKTSEKAQKDFEAGNITATEALQKGFGQAAAAVKAESDRIKQSRFGGDPEARKALQSNQEALISSSTPMVTQVLRQVAQSGGDFEQVLNSLPAGLREAYQALGTKELQDAFKNISKEIERTKKFLAAMNLGLRGPTAAASAMSAEMERFAASVNGTALPAISALSYLEKSFTEAGAALDKNSINKAVTDVSDVLNTLGADPAQVEKFATTANAFNTIQQNYEKVAADIKGIGKVLSPEDLKKEFASRLSKTLPQELQQQFTDIIENIPLDDAAKKALEQGDLSAFGAALGEAGKKFLEPTLKIIQDYASAQAVLVDLTKQRIAAEREAFAAQKEALSLALEGRELQARYGGRTVTPEDRRQNILARANVGAGGIGLTRLQTGSAAELSRRNREIRANFARTEAQVGAGVGAGTAQGEQLRANAEALQQAQKDQVSTIRELIKLEEENLNLIKEKNKVEQDSIDALITGDIEKFFEQQAVAGATAAIATGNQALANAFGASALGGAAQDIRRQQEAGQQTLFGQQLAGAGGLTERAFGAAVGARGITDPRLAQVASGTTAEQLATQERLRGLGGALAEAGQVGADISQINLQTAQMNVRTAEIKLNDIQQRAADIGVGQIPQARAKGGLIYANRGIFVPRGTDTVPAMLTPGEFVVRREAVQRGNNLQILQSMNRGTGSASSGATATMAGGGIVRYRQNGSNSPEGAGVGFGINPETINRLAQSLDKFNTDLSTNIDRLNTTSFSVKLDTTNINVNLTGGSFLEKMKDDIRQELMSEVATKIQNYRVGDGGSLRENRSVLG